MNTTASRGPLAVFLYETLPAKLSARKAKQELADAQDTLAKLSRAIPKLEANRDRCRAQSDEQFARLRELTAEVQALEKTRQKLLAEVQAYAQITEAL